MNLERNQRLRFEGLEDSAKKTDLLFSCEIPGKSSLDLYGFKFCF